MYQNLAILAAFVLVYSAVAGRLEKTPISGAIVAMGFGLVCGPLGLGIFTPHVDGELLRTLAELTLALVLFTDAANANLSVLKISLKIPERLLLIGLPSDHSARLRHRYFWCFPAWACSSSPFLRPCWRRPTPPWARPS